MAGGTVVILEIPVGVAPQPVVEDSPVAPQPEVVDG